MAVGTVDVAGDGVDPRDAPGLGVYPPLERGAAEPIAQRAHLLGLREPRREGGRARVLGDEADHLREGERADEVVRREAGAVGHRDLGRVDVDGVDQEAAFDLDPLVPAPLPPEHPAELLQQHLGVPVLAGVEDREDPVLERSALHLGQGRCVGARLMIGVGVHRGARGAEHADAVVGQDLPERSGGEEVRVGHREIFGAAVARGAHGALGPEGQAPRGAEEIDVVAAVGRKCTGAVLQRDVAEVRGEGHRGRRVDHRPRSPGDVDAVVIEAKSRDRGGVPPIEIVRFPAGVHHRRLEVAPVPDQVAPHHGHASGAELFGEELEFLERVAVAGAGRQRVGRIAADPVGRVTPPVEDQVTLQDPVRDGAGAVDRGLHLEVRGQQCRGDRTHDDLRVARRDEEPVGVPGVERAAPLVDDHHTPEVTVEGGGVEAAVQALLQALGG